MGTAGEKLGPEEAVPSPVTTHSLQPTMSNATPTGELRMSYGLTRPGSDVDVEAEEEKKKNESGHAANCATKTSNCLLCFALR
jgi:hypothetical protein